MGFIDFFSKPFDNEFHMWEITFPLNENESEYVKLSKKEIFDKIIELAKDWNDTRFYYFLKLTHIYNLIIHPIYDHIPTFKELEKIPKNIILVGDSIHPMSPFIGLGANEAIYDCYELVKIL